METLTWILKLAKKLREWSHLNCQDIILMPDKWEFPWFASWDLAIQSVQFASIDLTFAQEQIKLLLSDNYMHHNGKIPGCEFDFGDPNPPILAWAVWKIHQHEHHTKTNFLKTVYPRLLMVYQWWQKVDMQSSNLHGNGFLGLDNISVFDRSKPPAEITSIKQADATGWVGLYALKMLQITLELCKEDICVADIAIRYLRDYLYIAKAINKPTDQGGLWHENDGFYYDIAHTTYNQHLPIQVKSWSGIIPLLGCGKVNLKHSPTVKAYLLRCDKEFAPFVCKLGEDDFFLTLVPYSKLKTVLQTVFCEKNFLSPYGIRSMSKIYKHEPYTFTLSDHNFTIKYTAGESDSDIFGGNSNWRGPIWLCMNYFFVECMETYSELNQIFTIPLSMEYPTGNGHREPFLSIACDLCQRVISLFKPDQGGLRPSHGKQRKYQDNDWKNLVLFYEYFNADTGRGCGASHQTGWSALYVEFLRKLITLKHQGTEKKTKDSCQCGTVIG